MTMPNVNTILLIMGIVLFVVLIFMLIFRKPDAKLIVPLFLVSVIMIAYPTIGSLKISDNTIEIQKIADSVSANPRDERSIQSLSAAINKPNAVQQLQKNPAAATKAVNALCAAAAARAVAGNFPAAQDLLTQAKRVAPAAANVAWVQEHLMKAQALQRSIAQPATPATQRERELNQANLEKELATLKAKYAL
jgi:hypothetical protein